MAHDISLDVLREIRIATPCLADWGAMKGDDKRRLCEQCGLHVHNLAALTGPEIGALVLGASGRVCARLYRRADGTILTADCPVGLAAARAKVRRTLARTVALAGVVISAATLWAQGRDRPLQRARLSMLEPFRSVYDRLAPAPPVQFIMGDVCIPLPPSSQTPTPQ